MSFLRSRFGQMAIITVALIAVITLVPFESRVVPAWKIRVVDETGKPYAGMEVSEGWINYSLELDAGGHYETRRTDDAGYVEFPERTLRLSLLSMVFRLVVTKATAILHGSTGISADVAATGPQGYKSVKYVPGKLPPEQLVLPSKE